MTLIKPFRALRPAPGRAAEVLAPPYDVLSSAEARARAGGKPWSFLHVSKAEIDLDPATDPYDSAVYAKAAANLRRMVEAGVLVRDGKPGYYVYRLTWRGHVMTGLAAVGSIADYARNRIRKHEHTTPAKEDDRVRQIEAVNAQTGPVMVGYRTAPQIDAMLAQAAAGDPAVDVTADDGVRHQLWVIGDEAAIAAITRAVDALPALYIADGHHRSAAAERVARNRGDGYFLIVMFPQNEMTILDYNRVLKDLNGHTLEALLGRLRERYTVERSAEPVRPAALGFASLLLARPPDLLVAGEGGLVAVRAADGSYLLSRARGLRLIEETWTRRSAASAGEVWPAVGASADGRLSCSAASCLYRARGHTVALIRDPAALAADCAAADLVVSPVPAWRLCRGPRVIDSIDTRRLGAHAVWLEKDGIRIATVADWRGERRWTVSGAR